ncbi:MAG: bifunctional glutamate N-acetyltransferase/amino-acid acetyltransferase ArgJ [Gammaproteobacteria bacterium]|nr:bifunctional glutamate N-acetyltransferase/amino-acid acetyltransferase ArgJ [Gammaproteobacteria bacterium]MCW8922353.1 bifunctional glutamate N-acetyltransferase/amino-acid acetyltransferase ArgJ [Gammaproteobacteria bacterium]
MAVGLSEPVDILPVKGIELASIACGIKSNGRDDLVLIKINQAASCAATFTKNAFCAAPVVVAKKHLAQSAPRALLINSGNANAGTGKQGIQDAVQSCEWLASSLQCKTEEILPFSTGVIGEPMPMNVLGSGIKAIGRQLQEDNWMAAARGIMTTDTIAKAVSKQFVITGKQVTMSGIAKGSGMICPNMATMLAFIGTDAKVENSFLQQCLNNAVAKSFNSITVDSDTSTNDACILIASGASDAELIEAGSDDAVTFAQAVDEICLHLAQSIIRDGEGATKFVSVNVVDAKSLNEARDVAYTVAHSPLVKTALFASDPNWGRILAAVGRAGVEDLILEDVSIFLDDVCIVRRGCRDAGYTEEAGQKVMDQSEITIRVVLGRGDVSTTVWTSDLSHEYVSINADYRS